MIEIWGRGQQSWYICGGGQCFAVKSCGNNRLIQRDFSSRAAARNWLNLYRPGVILCEVVSPQDQGASNV